MQNPVAIAGGGRVGQALGRLLAERGTPVAAVACRSAAHAEQAAAFIGAGCAPAGYGELSAWAERTLIAVPDDAIEDVAARIAAGGMRRGLALHTSGALGHEALEPLARQGVHCGGLHPLQTVPSPSQGLAALRGAFFAVGGDEPAAKWAEDIAGALGGHAFRIAPGARPLYHAAAVMASNYLVALVDAATSLMERAGVAPDRALPALAPLVEASARNALALGPEKALTGPIRRGDAATVMRHLAALADAPPSVRKLYRAAGAHAVHLARRGGLEESKADALENLLRE
ncbi:MAG: DUF2520 domain-containing protein [Bryobacteraceae bacterium]|nr:DUF2520 domain-containing protein [Bryobacteraceae bacterium]